MKRSSLKAESFSILDTTGKGPSDAFGELYKELHKPMMKVYDTEDQWGKDETGKVFLPPEDPAVFIQEQFLRAQPFHREFTQAYFSLLQDLRGQHWKVMDKELWEHQKGKLGWLGKSICDATRKAATILIRDPQSTGKTAAPLGVANVAFRRWQAQTKAKGCDPMVGAFCTQKPTHMAQQAFSQDQRIFRQPPYTVSEKQQRKFYNDCAALIGPAFASFFKSKDLSSLFTAKSSGSSGRDIVIAHLGVNLSAFQSDVEHAEQAITLIGSLLDGTKVTVNGIYHAPVLLDPLPTAGDEKEVTSYGGDAFLGTLVKDDAVLAGRPEWQLQELEHGKQPEFFIGTTALFTAIGMRRKFREVLRRLVFSTCDEVRSMSELTLTWPIQEAHGKHEMGIHIAATAYDTQKRPWKRRSPKQSIAYFIQSKEAILPNMGFDLFPGEMADRVSVNTEEAWGQLRDAHFADLPILTAQKQKQPYEGHCLIAVHPKAAREYAYRFEKEYGKRGIQSQILCMDGKTPMPDRETMQLWFMHNEGFAKVLVASKTEVVTALDFANIANATAAVPMSDEDLDQFFGRLAHSNLHRTEGKGFRGLFRQQLFCSSDATQLRRLAQRIGYVLPEKDARWQSCAILLSSNGREEDQRLIAKSRSKYRDWFVGIPDILQNGERRQFHKNVVVGTPLEYTAPNTRNPLEAALIGLPVEDIELQKLMEWAVSLHPLVANNAGSLMVFARQLLQEMQKSDEELFGEAVIAAMKKKISAIVNRAERFASSASSGNGIRQYSIRT